MESENPNPTESINIKKPATPKPRSKHSKRNSVFVGPSSSSIGSDEKLKVSKGRKSLAINLGKKKSHLSLINPKNPGSLSVGIPGDEESDGGGLKRAKTARGDKRGIFGKKKSAKVLGDQKQNFLAQVYDFLPDTYEPFTDADWKANEKNEKQCNMCSCTFKKGLANKKGRDRHHCRRCGDAVCTNCWSNKMQLSKNDPTECSICDRCVFELSNPNFTKGQESYVPDRIAKDQAAFEQQMALEDKNLMSPIKEQSSKRKQFEMKKRENYKQHKTKEKEQNEQLQKLKKEIDVVKNELAHKEKDIEPIKRFIQDQEDDIKLIQMKNSAKKEELENVNRDNTYIENQIAELEKYLKTFPVEQQDSIEDYMNQKRMSGVFSFVDRNY